MVYIKKNTPIYSSDFKCILQIPKFHTVICYYYSINNNNELHWKDFTFTTSQVLHFHQIDEQFLYCATYHVNNIYLSSNDLHYTPHIH